MTPLKLMVKRVLPEWMLPWCRQVRRVYLAWGGRISYAEGGEDLLLASLLAREETDGFYVDVGAHHPTWRSNTYRCYRSGWRGINVDPIPGMKSLFDRRRPRDVNVECGVASQTGMMTYYLFQEPEVNGFCGGLSRSRAESGAYHLLGCREVPVVTLRQILDEHLPKGVAIDILTVDVEGMDLEVLQSNDWRRYRPRFVLVEIKRDLEEIGSDPIYIFLSALGYRLRAKASKTAIFERNDQTRANPT
jgi:FkbM family methyltransferase